MNVRTALLLLSILLTAAASAQTFEQLAELRLADTTPRTARAVALGGAIDPLGDAEMAANPATLASVKRPMFLVQGTRNLIGATRIFVGPEEIPTSALTRIEANGISQAAAAIPAGAAVIGVYYASEPRLAGPDPRTTSFGSTPYQALSCPAPCGYLFPVVSTAFERMDRRYGVAVAWERGAIAFGAGAEMQRVLEVTETPRGVVIIAPIGSARLDLAYDDASLPMQRRAVVGLTFGL